MTEVTPVRSVTSIIDRVRQGETADWLAAAVAVSLAVVDLCDCHTDRPLAPRHYSEP
jgi:hypothetical protein